MCSNCVAKYFSGDDFTTEKKLLTFLKEGTQRAAVIFVRFFLLVDICEPLRSN